MADLRTFSIIAKASGQRNLETTHLNMCDGICACSFLFLLTSVTKKSALTFFVFLWATPIFAMPAGGDPGPDDVGRPTYIDTSSMDGNTTFFSVATGSNVSCGLASDGKSLCWGKNTYGQAGNNSTTDVTKSELVHTLNVPNTGNVFRNVYGGTVHKCALTHEGKAYCWGNNENGKLGDNSTTDRASAVPVDTTNMTGDKTFAMLALGYYSSCGISTDNIPYCWGRNQHRQLGDNTTTQRERPVAVDLTNVTGVKDIIDISVYSFGGCILTAESQTYCWGENWDGTVGDDTTSPRSRPVAINTGDMSGLTSFRQLSSASNFNCGITVSGVAHCWGDDTPQGFLGAGVNDTDRWRPYPIDLTNVTGEQALIEIRLGHNFSCARSSESNMYCWGNGGSGKMGNGDFSYRNRATPVSTVNLTGSTKFKKFQPQGTSNACGISGDGIIYCTGANGTDVGQPVGDGTTTARALAVSVSYDNFVESDVSATELSGGRGHWNSGNDGSFSSCAILAGGQTYCWGRNVYNQVSPFAGDLSRPTLYPNP